MASTKNNMPAQTKITAQGGFHGAEVIKFWVNRSRLGLGWPHMLTDSQRKRADRHFCGISGCKCGGLDRATIHGGIKDGETLSDLNTWDGPNSQKAGA